jgi:hypothetical protein
MVTIRACCHILILQEMSPLLTLFLTRVHYDLGRKRKMQKNFLNIDMYHLKRKRQSNKTKGMLKERKELKNINADLHESGALQVLF